MEISPEQRKWLENQKKANEEMSKASKSKTEKLYAVIAFSGIVLFCLMIFGVYYSIPSPQEDEQPAASGLSSDRVQQSAVDNQVSPSPLESPVVVVDVQKIAGKSEAEVATILGEPTSSESTKYGKKCSYTPGDTEIVFINGKADWITISSLKDAPYSEEALPLLGIEQQPATFSNESVMRWEDIPGLLELSIFPSQESVDYAYIKTATP